MDVLSDVLAVTRVGSAVLGRAELRAPWGLRVDPMNEAAIHVVQRGACWLRVADEAEPRALMEGDVVLVAGGNAHSLSDAPDTPLRPYQDVLRALSGAARDAGDPPDNAFLCAKYMLDARGPHPLVSLLPRLIHLSAEEVRRRPQLALTIDLLRLESFQADEGTDLVVPRLLDSLLVFILRAWIEGQPTGAGGWFGALRDAGVNRALRLIHEQPAHPWTIETLAKGACQSRATFARRFTRLVGEPPLAYVARWRMSLARRALRDSERSIATIAEAVGYDSVPAFAKAFRRYEKETPGRYRTRTRAPRHTADAA